MSYASVHDMFVPPGSQWTTHKWDWFSGSQLKSWWTFTDIVGTGSGAMNDTENGGYEITSGTTNGNYSGIDFNDIRHYSNTGVVVNITMSRDTATTAVFAGLTEQSSAPPDTRFNVFDDTSETFKSIKTGLNTTNTTVNSTIVIDTAQTYYRLELNGSSAVNHINGSLECLSTTNLPDVAMQPHVYVISRSSPTTTHGSISYLEAYNT